METGPAAAASRRPPGTAPPGAADKTAPHTPAPVAAPAVAKRRDPRHRARRQARGGVAPRPRVVVAVRRALLARRPAPRAARPPRPGRPPRPVAKPCGFGTRAQCTGAPRLRAGGRVTRVRRRAATVQVDAMVEAARRASSPRPPPPTPPRTKWTRRVPHPVLIGHTASLRRSSSTSSASSSRSPPPPPSY